MACTHKLIGRTNTTHFKKRAMNELKQRDPLVDIISMSKALAIIKDTKQPPITKRTPNQHFLPFSMTRYISTNLKKVSHQRYRKIRKHAKFTKFQKLERKLYGQKYVL